jgi:uncharacterized protein YegL
MAKTTSKTKKPKTPVADAPKTLVTMLLDRSGSMGSMRQQTIDAVNGYLAELRTSKASIHCTLIQFDAPETGAMDLRKVFVARPIAEVADLGLTDFEPRGLTPLLDAVHATISAVSQSLVGKGHVKPVVVIQTDGHENASREASWEGVRALVKAKTAEGWQFVFMGAGLESDAYHQAGRMGLSEAATVSYGKDSIATRAVFSATAHNIKAYAEGLSADTVYSDRQKRASGDKGVDKAVASPAYPAKPDPSVLVGAWPVRVARPPAAVASPALPTPPYGGLGDLASGVLPRDPLDLRFDTGVVEGDDRA